jgi:putative transposase
MPRSKTLSFIQEFPLETNSKSEKELNARSNAGLRLYNACLGEAESRLELSRNHPMWEVAKAMPSRIPGKKKGEKVANPEKSALFNLIHAETGWTDYSMQEFAVKTAKASRWIAEKVDCNTIQKLGTRAFKATERLLYGNANSIRFKGSTRFRSMEGKTNKQGIRFKDGALVWGKLIIPAIFDQSNLYHAHALSSKIKYVRVIRKEQKGYQKWFVQLVLEGEPYADPKKFVSTGTVGLDLNISNLAVVGDDRAELLPFADGVPSISKEVAALQRQMARSDRANNPDNYELDFEAKRGRKTIKKKGKNKKRTKATTYNRSNRYQKLARKHRELNRVRTARAKTQNQRLVNEVLRIGSNIKTENVSVKGWQKRYGKAISLKSPGFVQSELERKAESAGGTFTKFSTQTTALSQTHLDGTRTKKSLSERVHRDNSGAVMHRDLFSAFLARTVNDDLLPSDKTVLLTEYRRLEPALLAGWQRYKEQSERGDSASWDALFTPGQSSLLPADQIATNLEKLEQIMALGLENSRIS